MPCFTGGCFTAPASDGNSTLSGTEIRLHPPRIAIIPRSRSARLHRSTAVSLVAPVGSSSLRQRQDLALANQILADFLQDGDCFSRRSAYRATARCRQDAVGLLP